jgi:hypothetical protein
MYVHGLLSRKRPSKRHDQEWRLWRFLMRLSELLRQNEARPRPKIPLPILQFQLIDPDAVFPEPKPAPKISHHRQRFNHRESRAEQPELRA